MFWADGPAAFEFLVTEYDFLGPERMEEGLAYHRPDLHVEVRTGSSRTRRVSPPRSAAPATPRIAQHAEALRQVLPRLDEVLRHLG